MEISQEILTILKDRAKAKQRLSITMPPEQIQEIKRIAKNQKVPYSTIIEMFCQICLADTHLNSREEEESEDK